MIPWYVPVALTVIEKNGLTSFLLKKIVGKHSRTKRFALQFLFCTILAGAFAGLRGELAINEFTAILAVIGLANGLAAYCQWKAIDVSLSKNSLFTFWDDIVAMSLSWFILKEGQFVNAGVGAGIVLSLVAVALFSFHSYKQKKSNGSDAAGLMFFVYVGIYSVIWGVAVFFMRYFALEKLPLGTFLSTWYASTLISAAAIFLLGEDKRNKNNPAFMRRDITGIAILSLAIAASLGLTYWSYERAPQVIVQPLFLVAEMIVPALLGLFVFRERKDMTRAEWIYFGIGVSGGILVGINFSND